MITRRHRKGDCDSEAVYSDCERYRYALTRVWAAEEPRVLFVMLNPSKATEMQNDPTVERCERRARALGYGAFRVMNLFAWRETDPKRLRATDHPVGADNDRLLLDALPWADRVIAGWGVHGAHRNRGPEVAAMLRDAGAVLHCLGLTKAGHPRHPLYIAHATPPRVWTTG